MLAATTRTARPAPGPTPVEQVELSYAAAPGVVPGAPAGDTGERRALLEWIRSQEVNAQRATQLLRDFAPGEFGTTAASPSSAHIHATNRLVGQLRAIVDRNAQELRAAAAAARADSRQSLLDRVTSLKDEGGGLVSQTEKIWNFYWEIFGQRQTLIALRLLAADRIALDCYQYTYQGLGKARPIPSPPPFSYMEAGYGPATYRRGVRLAKLGLFPNPFPIVKLPEHRLVCPWTLGAIPHEVAHNLQSDLGLWMAVPRRLLAALRGDGLPRAVYSVWVRWQKEIFADLMSVLLIGPAYIGSLMDVVGKSPAATVAWNGEGVHPTPFLRVLINLELVRRLGFQHEAHAMRRAWLRLYPPTRLRPIPPPIRRSFHRAMKLTVDAICETAYPQLGGRTLREVVAFRPQDQTVAVEAAHRLARGADPGIIPERFMLAAVRYAFDRKLAAPEALTRNFYETLGRR
ncbi:MAG TPA: hypothetical protein VHG30_13525 [Microvirga sp.]|nr:hypothetical protein [Microvirga sp.]